MFGRSSKKKRMPEFQAIIMAAGRGSRMMQLTSDMPKALLPVANKPMIWYPVNLLEKNGFKDVTIVVTKSSKSDIKKTLEECIQVEIQIHYHCIPDNVSLEDFGTIDALKSMKDKITHDVLILSCDLICDFFSLNKMADIHRTHDASVTVMLSPAPKVKETPVPLPKVNRVLEKEYFGFDGRHPEKVVFLSPESNIEEGITFTAAQIKRTPFIQLSPDLIDCHVYMIRKDVLKLINNDKFLSLRMEFLPWLVDQATQRPPSMKKKNIFSLNGNMDSSNKDLELIDNKDVKEETHRDPLDDIQCYAFIADDELMSIRACTLVTYCEANRMIAKRQAKLDKPKPQVKSSQICPDSLTGVVGLKSGEKLVIKGSIVGDHCNIGDNVKVINSVIMDHVTIGSNVTLSGCIICSDVHIEDKTDMKECLVSKGQKIPPGNHSNKEFLSKSQMMEIDD